MLFYFDKSHGSTLFFLFLLFQLEEDRLLASGRTKIPGMKTRMELAWHKEREEQTRLLQETSTLARDLRQTLFEVSNADMSTLIGNHLGNQWFLHNMVNVLQVERERDKERLEAKRRMDQIKKTTEEEQEENRKKVMEVIICLHFRGLSTKLKMFNC